MGGKAATGWLPAALVLLLAACSWGSKDTAVNPNLYPSNYRQEVLKTMQQMLGDAGRARNAFISDPVLAPVGTDQRYMLCLRDNELDASGQYVGPEYRVGYFYGGHLNQLVDATDKECGKAAYKPFPELDRLTGGR
jgi:hypothetical protein